MLLFLMPQKTTAQQANAIIGKWLNASGEGQIAIFNVGGKYFGKLVWLKNANDANGKARTDKMNIRPWLRKRPVLGLLVLKDFVYAIGIYQDGMAYDPRSGKLFASKIKLRGNELTIDAYIGMFLVHSELWKRAK